MDTSSYLIFQKLLMDKKGDGTNTMSSEIKDQDCQEPLKEEEYKKLRDILQQRDNEISILPEAVRNASSMGLSRERGTEFPWTQHLVPHHLLLIHVTVFRFEVRCLF